MKWNRWLVAVPAALIALGASACENGLTDVNKNPNAPEVVPVENVLLSGIWDVAANAGNRGVFGQWTQLYHAENWAQHIAQPVYNDEDLYEPRDGVPTNIWDEMYYALTDLLYVKETAAESGDDNMWAAAEVMSVYGFMFLTDYFGDIPYTEALSLDEDVAFPVYTPQSEIYPDLISRLATAADMINTSESVDWGDFDPVYAGDMQGWLEFANSLQLRLAMRTSNTEMASQAAQSFQAAWNADIFDEVSDGALVHWTSSNPSANPIWEGIILAGRTGDFRMSVSLIDRLKALNDPRLPIYADPAVSDGEYRGLRNGLLPSDYPGSLGAADFSTIGSYFLRPTMPSVLMSYSEVLFLGAEAAERGWIAGSAADLYKDGIEAAMLQYDVDPADIDAYLAQPEVAYTGLDDIYLQKWISLFLAGPEAFAEMRRVGWMDLQPAENSNLDPGEFPARLYYPPEEGLYNPDNYEAAGGDIPITTPVWWMGS